MRETPLQTRAIGFARELPGILGPLTFTVLVAVVALRLLNLLPAYWQSLAGGPPPAPPVLDDRIGYPDLETAEADLKVTVLTPRYFPSTLVWPPSSVRGQREPARVVSLLFRTSDGQQALQIREVFSPGEDLPFPVPEPVEIVTRQEVTVNGSPGLLLLGRDQGGAEVNQLRWRISGVHLVVTTIYPPEELLRISESMHP